MTNKKFIAYNLIATGLGVFILAFSSGFFSNNEDPHTQSKNTKHLSVIPVQATAVTATERENITFILGEDEGPADNYYTEAFKFYRHHPTESTEQVVTYCRSLLEVRNHLAIHYSKGQLPWGKINLVVHGNEWSGLDVATLPGGKRTTSASLKAAIFSGAFQPLPDYVADACTEFHVHGCAVGKDKKLLKNMARAFGKTTELLVKSSPYFIRYDSEKENNNGFDCHRSQLESWYAFYPKTYRSSDAQLIQQLKSRYPNTNIDWEDALSRSFPRHRQDLYHTTFAIPILWTVAYPDKKSVPDLAKWKNQKQWLNEQEELQKIFKEYGIERDLFQWTFLNVDHELENGKKIPAIKAIGLCSVLTVLRPVGKIGT